MRFVLLALLAYPFAEIFSISAMVHRFGGGPVLLYLLITFLTGVWLLRQQGLGVLLGLGAALQQGGAPSLYSMLWPLRTMLAGLLLAIPGPVSDLFAVLLLLPLRGPKLEAKTMHYRSHTAQPGAQEDVIEGEFSEVEPNKRDHQRLR